MSGRKTKPSWDLNLWNYLEHSEHCNCDFHCGKIEYKGKCIVMQFTLYRPSFIFDEMYSREHRGRELLGGSMLPPKNNENWTL